MDFEHQPEFHLVFQNKILWWETVSRTANINCCSLVNEFHLKKELKWEFPIFSRKINCCSLVNEFHLKMELKWEFPFFPVKLNFTWRENWNGSVAGSPGSRCCGWWRWPCLPASGHPLSCPSVGREGKTALERETDETKKKTWRKKLTKKVWGR